MEVPGRRLGGSDDQCTGVLCDPCKGENEDENAEFYCTECNEYLCIGCEKTHRRLKMSKDHALLGRDSMPSQKLTSFVKSTCSKHGEKPIEYYCSAHDDCCCSACATMDHKQCNVDYIDDIATEFENSKEYKHLEKAMAELIGLLKKTQDSFLRKKTDLQSTHDKFIADVKSCRSEINKLLDSLEQATVVEVKRIRDIGIKTSDSITTTCDTMLADIQYMSSTMQKQKKYKQERQLVISSKAAMTRIKTYSNKVDYIQEQNVDNNYTFQDNEKLRQILKDLNSLGEIKYENEEKENVSIIRQVEGAEKSTPTPSQSVTAGHVGDINIGHSTDTKGCKVTASRVGDINIGHSTDTKGCKVTASRVGDINIRHSTDTEHCWITGGVMVDNNKLALVDRHNSSVKVVDVYYNTVISCIKLSERPWGVTCVNQNQVVVTTDKLVFLSYRKLGFLRVGKTLSIEKELHMDGECLGIVYTNNTFIVTFIKPETCVKIINMRGDIMKIFKANKAGDALFSLPRYITLSTDEQTIYVSDLVKNSVTSMSLDGTVHHVYTADNMKSTVGLAVDRNDNVYIAGYWSDNIHQLSREGQLRQVLLGSTHRLDSPHMVVYCKTGHKLYISNNGGNNVSLFQLQ